LKIPKFCGKFKKSWQKANIFTYLVLSELIPSVFFLVFMAKSPTKIAHCGGFALRNEQSWDCPNEKL